MRKIITGILLCFVVFRLDAQQTSQYKYHIFDNYLLNPAYVGNPNYYSILVGHDQRFYGLSEGSPQTYYLSVHSRVGQGYLFKKDGKINQFFSKFGNTAIGFQFYQYNLGADYQTNIGLTYGYHLDLKQNLRKKNPRKLVLALTPRLQGMWFNSKDLRLIGSTLDGAPVNGSDKYWDSGLGEYARYRSWFFNADVASLFQTIHFDAGLGALNFVQGRNKLETDLLYVDDSTTFATYDSLYPTKLMVNTKLKFLDLYTSDKFDVYFVPNVTVMYSTKRNYMEFFVDLKFDSRFKKHIAGIRKEVLLNAELGLNIYHSTEYQPLTLMRPYIALDFANYTITYAYSIYPDNDLILTGAASGGSQISILFKLSNDRTLRENKYTAKFTGR